MRASQVLRRGSFAAVAAFGGDDSALIGSGWVFLVLDGDGGRRPEDASPARRTSAAHHRLHEHRRKLRVARRGEHRNRDRPTAQLRRAFVDRFYNRRQGAAPRIQAPSRVRGGPRGRRDRRGTGSVDSGRSYRRCTSSSRRFPRRRRRETAGRDRRAQPPLSRGALRTREPPDESGPWIGHPETVSRTTPARIRPGAGSCESRNRCMNGLSEVACHGKLERLGGR